MQKSFVSLAVFGALLASGASSALAAPDWSKVPKTDIHVFHPGVSPLEWVQGKGEHSGAVGLKKGESCAGCHIEDGKLSLDVKRLLSKELEPKGAPKVGTYPVGVQAAFDATNLYVRLTFKAPAGSGDKSDKENEVKASIMFPNDKVPMGEQVGCWATCHKDARTMPGADDKKTKHAEAGVLDLMQWRSGGKSFDGSVSDKRNMEGGKAGASAEGSKSGDTYTVTFTRKLAGNAVLAPGKAVTFGVAIHADNAGGRFHHVSFNQTIGLGTDGDVKAVKQ
ncbi:MAG: ethylbenzene dehydrogenase-related protein [Betaproteobacteria bacterium]|nr:ethylbenzene dehydrogenase-related protein [Betaproteobacteria bacterium]MCL2886974.1 ethylbenzene dehydrogenase-related protein [Betaproteobacteria bacterium]